MENVCPGKCSGLGESVCEGCWREGESMLDLMTNLKLTYCGGTAISEDKEIARLSECAIIITKMYNKLIDEIANKEEEREKNS